jgi:hypothetical protein
MNGLGDYSHPAGEGLRLPTRRFILTSLWCGVYETIVCYTELGFNKQCVYHMGETADVP